MIPIAIVLVVGLIAAGVIYLVLQSNNNSGGGDTEWQNYEVSVAADTSLPGEGVDLQKIYNGKYGGGDGTNNTAAHVTHDVDYATDQGVGEPPAGGPHWGSASCGSDPTAAPPFCGPAPWGIYTQPWDAETVVHNLEHGGIVVWYNTSDQQVITSLQNLIEGYLNNDALIVMMPYPDLKAATIGISAWGRRESIPVADYNDDTMKAFIDAMKCRFNPETLHGSGC